MRTVLGYLLAPALGVTAAHAQTSEGTDAAPKPEGTPSNSLRVFDAVKAPRDFDLTAIKALAASDSGPADVVCAPGATVAKVNNFRGVRLTVTYSITSGLRETGTRTRGVWSSSRAPPMAAW